MVDSRRTLDSSLKLVSLSLRRYFVDEYQQRKAPALLPGKTVLDVGGTRLQKRGVFDAGQYPCRVYYANLMTDKSPDVQADAIALPFQTSAFDVVICAEIMEHVPNPAAVIAEAYRVLNSGGTLLITVPFLYHLHGDPYDYGRYTETWWHENLSRAGFTTIETERQGGFFSVLVDMLREWFYHNMKQGKPRPGWLRRRIEGLVIRLKRWAVRRDAQPAYRDDAFYNSYTTGFGICCRKP